MAKAKRPVTPKSPSAKGANGSQARSAYPRHNLADALRIPRAILDQNAGKQCTDDQAAVFLGLKSAAGPFAVEISPSLKYGFLTRASPAAQRVE